MLCLLGFATQNLGSLGLSGGRARNALDASVANVSGRSNRNTVAAAMGSFGKLIEELPAMMQNMAIDFTQDPNAMRRTLTFQRDIRRKAFETHSDW